MNWYDAVAEGYDELRGEEQRAKLRRFKPYIKPDMRVLDVGFGTGISDDVFNTTIIGVEPNEGMLQSYDGDAQVYNQSAEDLDTLFGRNTFDAVLCVSTAHHFENADSVFQKVSDVLRPEGFFFISVFADKQHVLDVPILDRFGEKNRCRVHRDIVITLQLSD
jgi:ubiquinone/menaquinone biosynthesis C-methylase UbiE